MKSERNYSEFSAWNRFFVGLWCLILFIPGIFGLNRRQMQKIQPEYTGDCKISPKFQGKWHQFNEPEPLEITESEFGTKGTCMEQSENRHLFHFKKKQNTCWRCVIFFPQHDNVLQYKESYCHNRKVSLEKACSFGALTDSLLVHLFRVDAKPIPCPVHGPLNFTYESARRGACTIRKSTVDGCADNSVLQFQFESCPNIQSWSRTEKYQCFGTWRSNQMNFLAAKLLDKTVMNQGENYRCIVYSKTSFGGKIGISADASCRELVGIDSATMKINYDQDSYQSANCIFPHWLRHYHHAKTRLKHWASMRHHTISTITKQHWITTDTDGKNVSVATCITEEDLGKSAKFVVHRVDNCKRGYYCIKVLHRDKQNIEIIQGVRTENQYEACGSNQFSDVLIDYDTLTLTDSVEQHCPNHGRYVIHGCKEEEASVSFGCTQRHQLVVNRHCKKDNRETYNCHGHWEESGVHYLVLKEQHTGDMLCYVYSKHGEVLSISGFYRHPCRLGVLPGVNNKQLVHSYNASSSGDFCQPSSAALLNSSSQLIRLINCPLMLLLGLLCRFYVQN